MTWTRPTACPVRMGIGGEFLKELDPCRIRASLDVIRAPPKGGLVLVESQDEMEKNRPRILWIVVLFDEDLRPGPVHIRMPSLPEEPINGRLVLDGEGLDEKLPTTTTTTTTRKTFSYPIRTRKNNGKTTTWIAPPPTTTWIAPQLRLLVAVEGECLNGLGRLRILVSQEDMQVINVHPGQHVGDPAMTLVVAVMMDRKDLCHLLVGGPQEADRA